jgi:hypothetical protein
MKVTDLNHYKKEQALKERAKLAPLRDHSAIAFEALMLTVADPYCLTALSNPPVSR